MAQHPLHLRVALAREGAAVERAHVIPHLQRYSVGHHSLNLITLLTLCWMDDHDGELPPARLLVAAAAHDLPERRTGDIPGQVKALLPDGMFERLEGEVLMPLCFLLGLTDYEENWLHCADKLEFWLWTFDEANLGNRHAAKARETAEAGLSKLTLPPSMHQLYCEVKERGLDPLSQTLEEFK
jgi:5'-deoxynucleotidase YfbR-like HD superfamily hydrolase